MHSHDIDEVPIGAQSKEGSGADARMRVSSVQSDECWGGKLLISDGRSRISPVAAVIARSSRAFKLKQLFSFSVKWYVTFELKPLMSLYARFLRNDKALTWSNDSVKVHFYFYFVCAFYNVYILVIFSFFLCKMFPVENIAKCM